MKIKEKVLMKDYTTFRIGGPADYLVEVDTVDELLQAIAWAKEHGQKMLVIGAGSNLLISDDGYHGLVIKLKLYNIEIKDERVLVGAGVPLPELIKQTLKQDLVGLEFAAGIPGTVGGAIRGNAGTYGLAMSDVVTKIRYLDENYELKEMSVQEVNFSYRHSIFKVKPYIILESWLQLKKGDAQAAQALIDERLKYRRDTQPSGPSAGCVFKNIELDKVDTKILIAQGVDLEQFKHSKIPAAYLIDQLGLKGKRMGDAMVSDKHANYILNMGQAKAEEVIMLISFIKQQVRDHYGLQLEEEIQIIF